MEQAKIDAHMLMLHGMLSDAGIRGRIEQAPNQYWPDSPRYDDVRTPWARVFTERGVITFGWRKNVISFEWTESFGVHGRDVVGDDKGVTHDIGLAHAWGTSKGVEVLRRLWAASERPG